MSRSKAEGAGGLTPVKDDNEAVSHFIQLSFLSRNSIKVYHPWRS